MEILTILLLLFIGFIANFLGSIVGGGGVISIPALIFLGLPPQTAIATDRFASMGESACIFKYHKSGKINYKMILPLCIIAVVGTIIGSSILLNIDKNIILKIMGVMFLLFIPLIILKKDKGIENKKLTKLSIFWGYALYFLVAIQGGFLGAGTGVLAVFVFIFFFGMSYIESNANQAIPWLIISVISTIIFAFYGLIRYDYGIFVLIGAIIGGYIGPYFALKRGEKFIKNLFIVIIILVAIKLIFF